MDELTKQEVRDLIIELLGELTFKVSHPYLDEYKILEVFHEDGYVCEIPLVRN